MWVNGFSIRLSDVGEKENFKIETYGIDTKEGVSTKMDNCFFHDGLV